MIEIERLSDIPEDSIGPIVAELQALLREHRPELELKRGVIRDTLLQPHAILTAKHQQELQRYLDARSLLQLSLDPSLASTDAVDHVLSNFNIQRQSGSTARGEVTIVVSQNTTVTVPAGLVFVANGNQYTSDGVYSARADASQVTSASDRQLQRQADGTFAFTIFVTAAQAGAEGLIRRGTLLIPTVQPKNFVTAFATGDFSGGEIPETNTELINRLQQGLAANIPANRVNMSAMLRNIPEFSRVTVDSVIGFSDVEMTRDQHTLFPVSSGGRADWYIRTQERLVSRSAPVEATFVRRTGTGSVWTLKLGRDAFPGLYEVQAIRGLEAITSGGSLEIISDLWGHDTSSLDFAPRIRIPSEAAFSRYQTYTAEFIDTSEDGSQRERGDTKVFQVSVSVLPLIGDIQDHFTSYDNRPVGSDILVRAPIPCFVNMSFSIDQQRSAALPDQDLIREALAERVNNTPFVGRLYASGLYDVLHGFLRDNTSVGRIQMYGRLITPERETVFMESSEVLEVPANEHPQVSHRTVQFFMSPADVSISTRNAIPVA